MINNVNDKSLVSIIVPNFNRANLIIDTLDSVSKQTYSKWECIIVDDGSTDDSEKVIIAYCEKDARFKYYRRHRTPKGAPTCRNIGLEKSYGEFIVFLDSDDLLAPWCLEKRLQTIKEKPDYDLWIFPTGHFIHTLGDSSFRWNIMHKSTDDLVRFILHDNPWCVTGPIWRKGVINELRGFDENALCWQDWELHIRMLISRYKYYKAGDDMIDAFYRKGAQDNQNSISSKKNNNQFLDFRIQLFRNFYKILSESGMSEEIQRAFKVSFWKILQHVGKECDNECLKTQLKYYQSINLFNWVEIRIFYMLFWNLGYNNRLIIFLRKGLRLFLKKYRRDIYHNIKNKDSIYSKTLEIDQIASNYEKVNSSL
jgi:glycosyltransferase involved in cell wall biosynthesis